MKKLILIGDSIRKGYQPFVEKNLEGKFEVWGPEENCGTSENILSHIEEWIISKFPDIVHMNCGGHDIKKEFNSDQPLVSLDKYAANLEKIFTIIKEKTKARIIWATITPINEKVHNQKKGFNRFEKDIIAYNKIALEISKKMGIEVNDLFEKIIKLGIDKYLQSDGTHFTKEGYFILGKMISEFIENKE